jgi:predicted metal-dependent phosphoesterase TrpH
MPSATHSSLNEVLIDPHSHSKFSDGLSTPRRMFLQAQRRGLRGLIITDHDTVRHWDQCLEAAKRTQLITALGVEISTAFGHILAYFDTNTPARKVARALKLDQGVINYLEVESVIRRVRDFGGVLCVPHPFGPFYPLGSKFLDLVDGVEEYNSWIFQDNKRFHNAFGYAKKYKIAAIGGSDSHYPYTIGFGASAVPAAVDFSKSDWFLHCVRQKLTRPIVQQRPFHRRINFIKSTVSIPLNMRYNAKFFRSKWRGYWKENYREVLARGLSSPEEIGDHTIEKRIHSSNGVHPSELVG